MKVNQLIDILNKMPQDSEVYHLYDGEPRTTINVVYESKNGKVITSDYEEVCYSTEYRPINAPTSEEDSFWRTEKTK